jgi:hypothetical protein
MATKGASRCLATAQGRKRGFVSFPAEADKKFPHTLPEPSHRTLRPSHRIGTKTPRPIALPWYNSVRLLLAAPPNLVDYFDTEVHGGALEYLLEIMSRNLLWAPLRLPKRGTRRPSAIWNLEVGSRGHSVSLPNARLTNRSPGVRESRRPSQDA